MKRPAFTLIEIVAVLGILVTVSLGGLWLSRRAQQQLTEDRFFDAFSAHWQNTLVQAQGQGGGVQFVDHQAIFFVGQPKQSVSLAIPSQFNRVDTTVTIGKDSFTQPTTVTLMRPGGKTVRMTFQMGWGALDIQR